jgi:flagellar biosynthesis chaperone FliJ
MMLATRDREAIDHYHDKQRRVYDRDFQRAEQKELDELALRGRQSPNVLRVPQAVRQP